MTWYKARDFCTEGGMQLPTLKTLSQVEAVSKELKSRGQRKKKSEKKQFENKISTSHPLLQLVIGSGCLPRTSAGRRMDSSSGKMARQWTKPLGTVEIQMMQKKAKRRASFYTLNTANCGTGSAQTLLFYSASFLLRSPRALNNQMSPLLPPHHQQPPIVPRAHLQKERPTFWCLI
jgi:hypothetical protein